MMTGTWERRNPGRATNPDEPWVVVRRFVRARGSWSGSIVAARQANSTVLLACMFGCPAMFTLGCGMVSRG